MWFFSIQENNLYFLGTISLYFLRSGKYIHLEINADIFKKIHQPFENRAGSCMQNQFNLWKFERSLTLTQRFTIPLKNIQTSHVDCLKYPKMLKFPCRSKQTIVSSRLLAIQSRDLSAGLQGKRSLASLQFGSVTQSCLTLCDPMNHSTPGLPVHHKLPEFTQTHVHRVGDAIQPSHPLSSPSPPAPNPSQHQGLFQ